MYVRSFTGGRVRVSTAFDHYDLMPQHLVEKVAIKKEE